MSFQLNECIKAAEKELEDALQVGLEIARQIQAELEREPLDDIFFFSTLGHDRYNEDIVVQ